MSNPERPAVAVVGGGFSGLMTALHLAASPQGPNVHLIERAPEVGRGVAYSRDSAEHLLNVGARNMSAWPDRPGDFVEWLGRAGPVDDAAFIGRARYGDYLQHLLAQAGRAAEPGRLAVEPAAAEALHPLGDGWRLRLAGGRELRVAAAVLALGNLAPSPPAELEPRVAESPAYVGDPWSQALDRAPTSGRAVLLGTGLTMVDVALRLARLRPGLELMAISRRGLVPRAHLPARPRADPWRPNEGAPLSGMLHAFRARAARQDWRETIDGLRASTASIWRGLSLAERRRFLRHLRPWWDVHRHRLAPEIAERLQGLIESGALHVQAGRIVGVASADEGLTVIWRSRAGQERRTRASLVVNCTGPSSDLERAEQPLLAQLVRQGLARADPCRLGLDVDDGGRLVGAEGRPHPTLFAVGPLTRGASWEITAVPDIRSQAADCAALVREALD